MLTEGSGSDTLTFERNGAARVCAAIGVAQLRNLEAVLGGLPPDQAGIRLHAVGSLKPLLENSGMIGSLAARRLGRECRPVRAILFDKTATTNWSLPWHQDRTIAVCERVAVDGFGPWTTKQGMLHVAPPFEILARMVTLRVHLDPVPESNAPLLVAPGSHRLGRIPNPIIAETVKLCGTAMCLADVGDVWVYSTPILHASEAARTPAHRRVLQIDFVAGGLPGGLQWLGV